MTRSSSTLDETSQTKDAASVVTSTSRPPAVALRIRSLVAAGKRLGGSALAWLLRYALPGSSIGRRDDSYAVIIAPAGALRTLGIAFAVGLIAWYYSVFLVSWQRSEYFGPITNIEEMSYSYTIGRNFAQYGFLQTMFLQDVSHSTYAEDHPYTYNHQPPGSDIITGAILRFFPENFRLLRLFFSIVFVIGIFSYFALAQTLLSRYSSPIIGYTALFTSGWIVVQGFDKQTSYHHPLLTAAPVLMFLLSQKWNKRSLFWLALVVTLAASFIVDYIVLAAIAWSWIFLYLTQVIRITFRQMCAFILVIALGIVLHLVQNMVFLGWDLFIRELMVTVGNRTVGVPTQDQVRDFYREAALVHHGSRPVDPQVLVNQLVRQFQFELSLPPGSAIKLVIIAVLTAGMLLVPRLRFVRDLGGIAILRGPWLSELSFITRLWIWIAGTVTLPNVMFPAFSQEVVLSGSGVNLYYTVIGAVALIACATRCMLACIPWPVSSAPPASGDRAADTSSSARTDDAVAQSALLANLVPLGLIVLSTVVAITVLLVSTPDVSLQTRVAFSVFALAIGALLAIQALSQAQARGDRMTLGLFGAWLWLLLGRTTKLLAGLAVSAILVFLIGQLMYDAFTSRVAEVRQVRGAIEQMRYARLGDLASFPQTLFMTNINTQIIGFFTRAPGFGVCELSSLPETGGVDSRACQIDFMRRHEYWDAQQPRYYFFFRAPELFPGFASCLPTATLQSVTRGGDSCVEELHARLAQRAEKVFDNGMFEVFDLTRPPAPDVAALAALPTSAQAPAPTQVTVGRTTARSLQVAWAPGNPAAKIRVETKRAPRDRFVEVGVANPGSQSIVINDLRPDTRYFFRIRACTDQGCSPYAWADGRT